MIETTMRAVRYQHLHGVEAFRLETAALPVALLGMATLRLSPNQTIARFATGPVSRTLARPWRIAILTVLIVAGAWMAS